MNCGDLPDPENGAVSISSTAGGGMATYFCDEAGGYVLVGVQTRVCQANGIWSDQEPTCEGKK